MANQPNIITYREFNDYYADANTTIRAKHDEFHVLRFSELGNDIVPVMGPFCTAYFQVAIGSEIQARVGVFDMREEIENYSMVIYLPGQILTWEKTGNWEGYVANVKESFLNLGGLAYLTDSFSFLHSLQPLVISLSVKEYEQMSQFFELLLDEQKELKEENIFVIRNLLQVLMVFINRMVSGKIGGSTFPELQYQKLATWFKGLVLNHYKDEKAVTYYAGVMGISPAYLAEAVKKVFKTTPKRMINEITFLHAKTLLASSDIGIKELAWSLNFDDYSHFVKFFKKMSGLTPAAFRNALKNKG
ncbi:AraC family transcriptional regulator [Pleomorphovibrio marinus]|uniref:AraC family transcriptional regulator n=1 Tax=Pleomorphovibrio marinus TaxID=2164132 RepID=UPI000E09ECCD|nr:helix-turn-helix domain-containing protein [Pleomorphovibrio marinus]